MCIEIIFLIAIFCWLIILENKVKALNDKNEELEINLHRYETLLESIEYEMENNYSKRNSEAHVAQNTTESAQVQEQNNVNTHNYSQVQEAIQTHQNKEETNNESGINKALSTLNQKRKLDQKDSISESSNINAETNKETTVKKEVHQKDFKDSTVKEEIHQNNYNYNNAHAKPKSSPEPQPPKEPISFVQIFSWIGGFILLLGIIFWIKYALENNIISPDMRVALGTIAGIIMWAVGAFLLKKPEVKTTADTLCACGLCTCYSAFFAAYYFYHLAPASITFILLSIVALASFATAVWKNAQYIGVLAQIIGFVTPYLFPFDSSLIWFLLAYAAIINVTAVAASLYRNWPHQLYTGLVFTFLSFIGIVNTGSTLQLTLYASLFILLYTGVASSKEKKHLMHFSFIFAFICLFFIALRTSSIRYEDLPYILSFASVFSILFGLLSIWNKNNELCFATLGFAFAAFILVAFTGSFKALLAFIVFISVFFGILTARTKQPYLQIGTIVLTILASLVLFVEQFMTNTETQYLPYYAGFAVFFTIFFGIIAFIQKNSTLLINTIVFSFVTFTLLLPYKNNQAYVLSIASAFTIFFGILSYKLHNKNSQYVTITFTAVSSLLLSILSIVQSSPSMNLILAYTMLAIIYYYFFAAKEKNDVLFTSSSILMAPPLFLFSADCYFTEKANMLLYWIFGWSTLVTLAIYFLKNYFGTNKSAWVNTVICNIYSAVLIKIAAETISKSTEIAAGSIALILSVIYAYLTYIFAKSCNLDEENDKFKLSCFICAPITLITLAIILHSTNEWRTMAFALEGLSLIVLWHYLKVGILQNIGLGLMAVVTIRLLFNPFVETYYPQTQLIFNWYLYTYTICAAILFIGSSFWREKEESSVPQIMRAVSAIIIFALINIEIANYFAQGRGLSFNFCGGLAEAAAYTIAWALYGALCMFNSTKQNRYPLRIGIGLISLALLKLFLSDIWMLSAGLRIIVLIGVAIILLAVSFIYQQFQKMKESVK